MMKPSTRPLWLFFILLGGILFALELAHRSLTSHEAELPAATRPIRALISPYTGTRTHITSHPVLYSLLGLLGTPLAFLGVRGASRRIYAWRSRVAGFDLQPKDYRLKSPFPADNVMAAGTHALGLALDETPSPERQVVFGFRENGSPFYLSDHDRSMHVHLMGQTGSGKTQSVIYPLLLQDINRRWADPTGRPAKRPVLFLDAKGAIENEDFLVRAASATGRASDLKIFSLNPSVSSHTYNPLFLTSSTDPRALGERLFHTFAPDMHEPYYRDMARELLINLLVALASIGKQITILDLIACISNQDILLYALERAEQGAAVHNIKSRLLTLRNQFHKTYSGLLTALSRYDHPAINAYDPDIVLERDLKEGGIVAFSLPATAYKCLARDIGILVLQHLQHIGAMRQMDRSHNQTPVTVFADEFYTFAYEGFVDAVNKLRDAHISLLLSHQSLADLDRISPEYSRAVSDSTRNKVMFYSNDNELCEQLARSVGTKTSTKLTKRLSADRFLNQVSTLEASAREADEFIVSPTQFKCLKPGQAYLIQTGIGSSASHSASDSESSSTVTGLNFAMLPPLRRAERPRPKDPDNSDGLHLYDLLMKGGL